MNYLTLLLFSFFSMNLYCQSNIKNSNPKNYFIISNDETTNENNLLKIDSILVKNLGNSTYDSTITNLFYQNLDSFHKKHSYNYTILSKWLFWSVKLKKYSEYTNKIIELVDFYYNENQENYYTNSTNNVLIEKRSLYSLIMEYGQTLNSKELHNAFKKINDNINSYDETNYTNLIYRANYYILNDEYDEAIDILNYKILGFQVNDKGEVTNNYNPFEVDYYLAIAYLKKGNKAKSIEYLDKIIAGESHFKINAQILKEKILKEK